MKEALKDKVIAGRRWRLGSKKREDLVRDYRCGWKEWLGGEGASVERRVA